MSNYVFSYYGEPTFKSPEEGANYKPKCQPWVGTIADPLVNLYPMGMQKKVSSSAVSDNGGSDRLTGFSIMKADSMDVALKIAKDCPHLEHGTIDVAEAMEM